VIRFLCSLPYPPVSGSYSADNEEGRMPPYWSRREMLRRTAVLGAVVVLPGRGGAQAAVESPPTLSAGETATLEAIVARLIPSDANGPGALEAGAARYIDRALGDAF